jgi:riboflavin kinase/FMN adenylyltransferase
MQVIRSLDEGAGTTGKYCVAIGFFDGVHLGHQQILRQTVSDARQHEASALVVTFDQHPNSVVAPSRVPPLIYSLNLRLRTIESLGADALWLVHFDEAFSRRTGEEFVRELVGSFGAIKSVCVGADFAFGYKRGGNVELLKRLGAQLHFAVHGMAAVALDGQIVSSTRIRQAIATGDLDSASQMLGRAYSLAGTVVKGDGMGRKLGIPTANLDVAGLALPPNGVYAARAAVGGKSWRAVLNIGLRPTLKNPNPHLQVEAHLLDFEGDLYGQELELEFVDRLRDEQKFPSLEELQEQIKRDIAEARGRF